jgi:hypothetical protein
MKSTDVSDRMYRCFRQELPMFQTCTILGLFTLSTISDAKKFRTIVTKDTIVKKGT